MVNISCEIRTDVILAWHNYRCRITRVTIRYIIENYCGCCGALISDASMWIRFAYVELACLKSHEIESAPKCDLAAILIIHVFAPFLSIFYLPLFSTLQFINIHFRLCVFSYVLFFSPFPVSLAFNSIARKEKISHSFTREKRSNANFARCNNCFS